MLPNFLIVGAMKAGTTSLRDYLARIEDVWVYPGEIRFFSADRNYERGLEWYERFFEGAGREAAVGEKSPGYSYRQRAPERIHHHLPNVKLIWIFRNPVARTYSHYWHAVIKGRENLSFSDAIARERARLRSGEFQRGYVSRSHYAEQVERYLQFFARDQMLFLLFEELVRRPTDVLNGVLEFVGVQTRLDRSPTVTHSNTTYAPRLVKPQWFARSLFGKGRVFGVVRRAARRKKPGYPKIDPILSERLRDGFRPYNDRLAALTGLDLELWR